MFRSIKTLRVLTSCLLLGASGLAYAAKPALTGIGRAATPAEIKAWDIDVRPDFVGLPQPIPSEEGLPSHPGTHQQ